MEKYTKRLVKVTKEHNDECKELLKLMGIPYIEVSIVYSRMLVLSFSAN